MKFVKIAVAALILGAAPALANEQVVVGATVTGPQGNPVGTIESVANGQATLDTGKHKVPLGIEMYGQGEAGPTISVTREQLDAMMDEQIAAAAAQRDAALVASAAVISIDNQSLGTVESVEGDDVVITLASGPIALKREHFAVDANGKLMALFTVAQLEQALAGASGAEAAS